jgi:hypothetical protein
MQFSPFSTNEGLAEWLSPQVCSGGSVSSKGGVAGGHVWQLLVMFLTAVQTLAEVCSY